MRQTRETWSHPIRGGRTGRGATSEGAPGTLRTQEHLGAGPGGQLPVSVGWSLAVTWTHVAWNLWPAGGLGRLGEPPVWEAEDHGEN